MLIMEYLFNVWPGLFIEGQRGTQLPLFFTACPNCVNDIWQKFPCAGSVARKVLASLYQSIWLMFPCLELPLDGNLLRASLANWNQISSAAWCDIDPYSTPRLQIDQYWFTIKNTPLLVQHRNQYYKAKGEKILKEEKLELCLRLTRMLKMGEVVLGDRALISAVATSETMMVSRNVRLTNKKI